MVSNFFSIFLLPINLQVLNRIHSMKYFLLLWFASISICGGQTLKPWTSQQDFLLVSSSHEVTRLWNELAILENSSLIPKDMSDQWTPLKQIHQRTSLITEKIHLTQSYDSVSKAETDSLIAEYHFLSKDLLAATQTEQLKEIQDLLMLSLVMLENEKMILANLRTYIDSRQVSNHLLSYSVNSATQYVAQSGWYIATISIQTFGIDFSKVKVIVEGKELAVINGVAELKFKPTIEGGKINGMDGIYEKKWKGKIIVESEKTLEFPIGQTYYTARPIALIGFASLSALYQRCANEIMINIPALGASYHPRFEISNPKKNKIELSKYHPGVITIFPEDKKVEIKLYNDSLFIDSYIFTVRMVPDPGLALIVKGKKVLDQATVKKDIFLTKPIIKPDPDETFKVCLPRDATFLINHYKVQILREQKIIAEEKFEVNADKIVLSMSKEMYSNIQSGDDIKISATKIIRVNAEGKKMTFIPYKDVFMEFKIE